MTKRQLPEWLSIGSLIAWIVPIGAFVGFPQPVRVGQSADRIQLAQHRSHRAVQILRFLADRILDPDRLRDLAADPASPAKETVSHAWFEGEAIAPDTDDLFGVQAVSRSLILFNALFALQSGLDLTYLWGGVNLPTA